MQALHKIFYKSQVVLSKDIVKEQFATDYRMPSQIRNPTVSDAPIQGNILKHFNLQTLLLLK